MESNCPGSRCSRGKWLDARLFKFHFFRGGKLVNRFSRKDNLEKCNVALKSKNLQGILWKIFILILLSLVVFPEISATNQNFKNWDMVFCISKANRWKSSNYIDINIFLSLENSWTILLLKEKSWKRIFNTYNELLQNHTQKHFMLFKTTVNWLFHDICYLVNSCKGLLYS